MSLAQVPQGPALTIAAGFDGFYSAGRWLPVRVSAENTGADFDGELAVTWGATTYRQALALPSPSRKRLEFYVRAADMRDVLRVALRDASGQVLTTYDVPVRGVLPAETLRAVVDSNALTEPRNPGTPEPRNLGVPDGTSAFISVEALPTSWRGYDGLDEVAIAASAARLQRPQAAALDRWQRVRAFDDEGELLAAARSALPPSPVDAARWQFVGWYVAVLAIALAAVPAVARQARFTFGTVAVVAIGFAIGARSLGALAVERMPVETRRVVHAVPGLDAPFVTTLSFARPAGRAEVAIDPRVTDALIEAADEALAHEVRYSGQGAAVLVIAGSLGETFSVTARGFGPKGSETP